MEGNSCECSDVVISVVDRPDKRNAQETSEANFSDKEVVTIPTEESEDGVLIDDKRHLDRKDAVEHSVTSTTSDHNGGEVALTANTTEEDPNKNSAPDGGWGWFVVLGSALIHILLGGFERSSGVLFLELKDRFGQSASATAWVSAIFSTSRFMMGPMASAMCHRFTIRFVVFVGSLLFALGVLVTGYAPNLTVVYVLYGLLGGFGSSLVYVPSLIIVSQYFNKKRGLAVGLSSAGVGLGTLFIPPLFGILFDHYGFQGACLILSGIILNSVIAAFLFRPVVPVRSLISQTRKEQKNCNIHAEQELLLQTDKPEFYANSAKPESCFIKTMPPENENDIPVIGRNGENVKSNKGNVQNIRQKSRLAKSIQLGKTFIAIQNLEPHKKKPLVELSLLKNVTFLSLCIAISFFTMAFHITFVFLPPLIKDRGMTELDAAYIVSITGVMDGVGKILAGFILDLKNIKKYRLLIYNGIMIVVGAVSLLIPSVSTFTGFALLCAFYGLMIGAYISQKSIIIIDILGVEKLTSSLGLLLWFQGVGTLAGPPISGFLKDVFGIYDGAFYLGGAGMIFGAFILLAGNVWKICRDARRFGSSLIFSPSLIIVSQYFNKKRGLAVGLSSAGVGLGTLFIPPLFGILFDHYGFQGACLILIGISLNSVIAAFLFRPVFPVRSLISQTRKEQKNGNIHVEQEHLRQTDKPEFYANSAKPESCCIKTMPPENKNDIPVIGRNGKNVKSNKGNVQNIRQKSRLAKAIQLGKTFIAIQNLEPHKKKPLLELSLLKNVTFLSLCIAISLFTMAFHITFVFLPPLIKDRGMTKLDAAYIVSITGVMDAVGKILAGFILDLKSIKKYRLLIYNGIMIVVGSVSLLIPSVSSFTGFALLCAFYGLMLGAYISQKSNIIIDILGVEKLTISFGLLLWFQGVGTLVGPPISGFLKDVFGVYDGAFYLGGAGMMLGAFILLAGNVWKICRDARSKDTAT